MNKHIIFATIIRSNLVIFGTIIQSNLVSQSKYDSFHIEGGQSAFESYPVCRGKQLTCSNNILNRMGEFNEVEDIISNKTKICLANCEDQVGKT